MSTPIFDAPISVNIPIITQSAGSYKLPSAIKTAGVAVDFTVGTWVFGQYLRPGQPAMFKSPYSWGTGVTITGDALGFLTLAWTAGAASDAGFSSTSMTIGILASNDAFTTQQLAASGNVQVKPASN